MLKVRVLLFGVKTTLKRVAEKLELAMHGLSELDSIMRSAAAKGATSEKRHRKRARAREGNEVDGIMRDASKVD